VDFGKYAVVDNVKYSFQLAPEMWWEFRPATVGDEMEMQRWIAVATKREAAPTWIEVAHKQIAIVSVKTNIVDAGLEEGGSTAKFEELLRQMPIEMLGELWTALGDVNPLWGPPRPRTPAPNETAEF
jgi:hypothetical protein